MRRSTLILTTAVALAGCRDSLAPRGAVDADFAGTYALQTIAGFPLPYSVLRAQAFNLEVTGDTVSLGIDGTYVGRTHYRRTQGASIDFPADTVRGTWTAVGSSVMVEAKGTSFGALVSSVNLTVDPRGIPFVYRKL